MDFSHFYLLGEGFIRGALRIVPRYKIDPFALTRGDSIPKEPIIFNYSEGREPRDLIGTELAVPYIFSDRVFEAFRDNQISGWMTYPVEIYGKDGALVKGYQGLMVSGRCGPIDNTLSKQEWRDPPSPQGNRYQAWMGLYFDPEKWDGSDIFMPDKTGYKVVTERFKAVVEKGKFKNMTFKPLTEVERPFLK